MTAAGDRPDVTVNAEQVLGQQIGENNKQINYYAGRPAVTWPHRVGVVPPLAQGFQMRSESQVLQRALADGSGRTAVLTQVLAGMGGIGKTQLAAAYAQQQSQAEQVDLLMWVTASNRDSVLAAYAQAAADLVDPPADETVDQRADRLLSWLITTPKRWLLVLDDLADPTDLNGLWPTGPTGQVLVTTRRRDASLTGSGRTVVEVGLFNEQQARAYLVERLDPDGTRSERLAEVDDLIADLDRLPLALAQAGSYMLDRNLTCAQYRRRLAKRRLEMVFPDDAPADEYASTVAAAAQTVAVAWSLSIEAANSLPPRRLALPLMAMASVLSTGIPTSLFSAPAAIAFFSHRTAPDDAAVDEQLDADDIHDALSNLHRLSLITRTDDTVRVHTVLQRATREWVADEIVDRATKAAADALIDIWPEQDFRPEYALFAQNLRDNTDALRTFRPEPLWTGGQHVVLRRSGRSRRDGGMLRRAAAYWREVVIHAEAVLGRNHPDTLRSSSDLGAAYQAAGQLDKALPLLERTVLDCETRLGVYHPVTLACQNHLASTYQDAGRFDDALALYREVLSVRESMLEPGSPDILMSRSNLAVAHLHCDRADEAMPLLESALADSERTLGIQHVTSLAIRTNLALSYRQTGRQIEAIPHLKRTLSDCEKLLGPDHPSTVASRNNLAAALRDVGQLPAALPLFERAFHDFERLLGSEHPQTLTSLTNLALALQASGRVAEALPLFERALAQRRQCFGSDHPDSVVSRRTLASAYRDAGLMAEAHALDNGI